MSNSLVSTSVYPGHIIEISNDGKVTVDGTEITIDPKVALLIMAASGNRLDTDPIAIKLLELENGGNHGGE